MVLSRLGRDCLSGAPLARILTKRATWPITSTPSRSILRFISRFGRRSRSAGWNASRIIRNFLFTAKLWQRFTHETGATAADEQAVRDGFAPLAAAGKLAAVLLQFPFSFHRTPENFARLTTLLDRFQDYQLVVEIRHSSWNDAELYALLARTPRRLLQHRSARHRPLHPSFAARHRAGRLHSPARAALRHLVQRRSGDAAGGALQLSLL